MSRVPFRTPDGPTVKITIEIKNCGDISEASSFLSSLLLVSRGEVREEKEPILLTSSERKPTAAAVSRERKPTASAVSRERKPSAAAVSRERKPTAAAVSRERKSSAAAVSRERKPTASLATRGLNPSSFTSSGVADAKERKTRSVSASVERERERERAPSGTIYLVRNGKSSLYKIGFTCHLERRMRELTTGNPEPLFLIGTRKGTMCQEKELHRKYGENRRSGEWFHFTEKELRAVLKDFAPPS